MNGSFTTIESRYLTPEERQHYLGIGLCAPVDAVDLERILEQGGWNDRIEELQDFLDSLRDEHAETVEDLEDLQLKVKRCMEFAAQARGLTVDMIRERVIELLV